MTLAAGMRLKFVGGIGHHAWVTYDLTGFGERQFEALCRAIAVRVLGDAVQAFGDGPDGGREVSWDGIVAYPGQGHGLQWTGYGVLQAKFRRQSVGTKDLDWLRAQLGREFAAWTDPSAARVCRGRMPEYLIVATNVRLSSSAGAGGIDQARAMITENAQRLGLKGWALWDGNQITAYLDAYPSIAQRFSAFITPSDVLAKTFETLNEFPTRALAGDPATRCPVCGTQQMCQRMPAIYAEERQTVRTRMDGKTYHTTVVSGLGKQIAPPALPRFPVLATVLAAVSAGMILNGIPTLVLLAVGIPVDDLDFGTFGGCWLFAAAVAAITIPRAVTGMRRARAQRPVTEKVIWLWHRSWCCRRCHVAWVATPDLPKGLWGRPFRLQASRPALYRIARGILAERRPDRSDSPTPR